MSSSIPLVRASSLIPLQLWLEAQGRQPDDLFRAAGLPVCPSAAPNRLMSLHAYMALVVKLAETEGPDLGARLASPEGYLLLGTPARALRASGTIREALMRISSSFHLHASHVFWTWAAVPGGLEVAESIPVPDTPEAHHQA